MFKLTLTLSRPAARLLDARVASGDWPDAAAIVEAPVDSERANDAKVAALDALDERYASGDSGMTFEQIIADARARHPRDGCAEAAALIAGVENRA